jgi:hypothetical protein
MLSHQERKKIPLPLWFPFVLDIYVSCLCFCSKVLYIIVDCILVLQFQKNSLVSGEDIIIMFLVLY